MDNDAARQALLAKRDEVRKLLSGEGTAQGEDRDAESDARDNAGDVADISQPLETQTVDDAIADGLQEKLDAIDRALQRVEDGTYGLSVQSGKPIPDARLEADPTAELTVEEAAALER